MEAQELSPISAIVFTSSHVVLKYSRKHSVNEAQVVTFTCRALAQYPTFSLSFSDQRQTLMIQIEICGFFYLFSIKLTLILNTSSRLALFSRFFQPSLFSLFPSWTLALLISLIFPSWTLVLLITTTCSSPPSPAARLHKLLSFLQGLLTKDERVYALLVRTITSVHPLADH